MKKKLLAVILCLCTVVFQASSDVTAAAPENTTLVRFDYIVGAKPGNIFSDTDTITFTQKVTNTASESVVSKYTWDVTDEAGGHIASYTKTGNIGSGETLTRRITIDNPGKFGIYTINVTEENYRTGDQANRYTETYSEEFSVCRALNESNINQSFGFNQKIVNGGDYKTAVLLMKGAGAKWHRESVMWQGVEPSQKGSYIQLGQYKQRLLEIKESGMNTVCVLTGRNPLYDNNNCPSSDEAIAAYAAFCTYVVTELHGAVDHYEIWNEWNARNFNPSLEPPETYAKVLKAAYTAIKAVDPDITVIGCDTAGMPTSWIGTVLYRLNGVKYMDALSVHCYDYNNTDGFPEDQFISEVEALKATMRLYRVDLPVWLTEVGFSTYDESTPGFVPGCTRETQLNSLVMLTAINRAYGLFDNLIQYCFNDNGDISQIESNWGVVNCWIRDNTDKPEAKLVPNGAKPAYLGLAAMNYFTGGNTDYIDMSRDGRSYEFEFYNHNLEKNVILAINGGFDNTAVKELQLDTAGIEIYDKYGNLTMQQSSETGDFTVETYSEPIYIVYEKNKISVTKNEEKVTAMSGLAAGDRPVVRLRGISTSEEAHTKLIVAQYEDGILKNAGLIDAAGSLMAPEDELTADFEVMDGTDSIVITCWDMDSLTPLVTSYEIN